MREEDLKRAFRALLKQLADLSSYSLTEDDFTLYEDFFRRYGFEQTNWAIHALLEEKGFPKGALFSCAEIEDKILKANP